MTLKIVITGGGSGGHLFPAIAVARQIKKIALEKKLHVKIVFIGAQGLDKERELLAKEGIKFRPIIAGKLRRYFSFGTISDLFKIPIGFIQSFVYLWIHMPDIVFSKGGYGSLPVVVVSWIYRIPVLMHESDSTPGLANKISSFFSDRIVISFDKTHEFFAEEKTVFLGNPIREWGAVKDKAAAKESIGIKSNNPVILVLGGSQGSRKINDLILNLLDKLLVDFEIIHQCGENNFEEVKKESAKKTNDITKKAYHLYAFLSEETLKDSYAASDLIIARAGANTISEISYFGKPSILIPIASSAQNHQTENAYEFARIGATIVVKEVNLSSNLLKDNIYHLISNKELMRTMGERAKKFSYPESAHKIAQEIINMALSH